MNRGNTIAALLRRGISLLDKAGVESPRLDCELLLAQAMGWERWRIMAHPEAPVGPEQEERFMELVRRRARREPLARILGRREFWSMELECDSACLVPRPETELLVEIVLERVAPLPSDRPVRVLDLGTGSGCIAVALAAELQGAQVVATDRYLDVVRCARRNAVRHRVADRVHFLVAHWLESLSAPPHRGFDFVVSNPPYIARQELASLAPEVREWDPVTALLGGEDGLNPLREICLRLPRVVRPGGWFVCEIGRDQEEAASALVSQVEGVQEVSVINDLAGLPRAIVAEF